MSLLIHTHLCFLPTDEGVPGLSIGSILRVRILPSDDAFGVFSFVSDSLSHLVTEGNGGTTVTLNIQRQGGTFDYITVYWEVEGEENEDISPTSGEIDFAEGVTEGEFTVTVNNDQVQHIPSSACSNKLLSIGFTYFETGP